MRKIGQPKIAPIGKTMRGPVVMASGSRSPQTYRPRVRDIILALTTTLAACGVRGGGEIHNPKAESLAISIDLKLAEIQLGVENVMGLGNPLTTVVNDQIALIVNTLKTVDQGAVNYYNVADQNQTEGRLYFKTSMIHFRESLADAVSWLGDRAINPASTDFVVPEPNENTTGYYIRAQHVDYLSFFVGFQHPLVEAFLDAPRPEAETNIIRHVFPLAMIELADFIQFGHDLFPGTTAN